MERTKGKRTDMLHAMPEHHLVEDFSSCLSNEPIRHSVSQG